jgi:hypothetical protein
MRANNANRKKTAGPQTHIHGNVTGSVLSGEFNGPVNIGSTEEKESRPSIVFRKEVTGSVFNFGPQQGIVSTGDGARIAQGVPPVRDTGHTTPKPGSAKARAPGAGAAPTGKESSRE